jgi:hypothetical protein
VATVPASVPVREDQSSEIFPVITTAVDQLTEVKIAAEIEGVRQETTLTVDVDKEEEKGRSKEGKEAKEKEEFEVSEEPIPHMEGSSTPPESRLPGRQAFIQQDERPAVGKGLL